MKKPLTKKEVIASRIEKKEITVPIEKLEKAPENPRKFYDKKELKRLVEEIKKLGDYTPLEVRYDKERDKYLVLRGSRRLKALKELGVKKVKCTLYEVPNERAGIKIIASKDTTRQDHTTIEWILFAKRMKDNGFKEKEIAERLQVSRQTVSEMIQVSEKLPNDILENVAYATLPIRTLWLATKIVDYFKDNKKKEKEYLTRFLDEVKDSAYQSAKRIIKNTFEALRELERLKEKDEEKATDLEAIYEDSFFTKRFNLDKFIDDLRELEGLSPELKRIFVPASLCTEEGIREIAKECDGKYTRKISIEYYIIYVNPVKWKEKKKELEIEPSKYLEGIEILEESSDKGE